MWWVWWMLAWGLCAGSREPDPLLRALAAAGKTRAALCMEGAACAAVLWSRHWLLVRASCIDNRRLAPARLLLHTEPNFCKYVVKTDLNWPGPVLARFMHPRYYPPLSDEEAGWWAASPHPAALPGQFDAALVLLAEPAAVPITANHSRAFAAVPPSLMIWLRSTMASYPGTWDQASPTEPGVYLASSPMRLLVLTVLLPSAALLLLCMLLLRYTAAPVSADAYDMLDDDDDIPYDEFPRKLQDELPGQLRTVV